MNLITEAWVPVLLPNGTRKKISPAEIPFSDAVRVAHPKAEHSALTTELLVCLFQTLAAPADVEARRELLANINRPNLNDLIEYLPYFELLGDSNRFMQRPSSSSDDKSQEAATLYYESPGENTLKFNKDLKISRHDMGPVCVHCAPVALFLNQSHARAAGGGLKTSPRGGSALAVLLEGRNLWHTICLNLLPITWFEERTGQTNQPLVESLPWMHTKYYEAKSFTGSEIGTLGILWWMPIEAWLAVEPNCLQRPCFACGETHDTVVTSWQKHKLAGGLSKSAGVIHPHAGYVMDKAAKLVPLEVSQAGVYLEQWQAITIGKSAQASLPAWQLLSSREKSSVQVRAFGFAQDNFKLLAFQEVRLPVIIADNAQDQEALRKLTSKLLEHALSMEQRLRNALKEAKYGRTLGKRLPNASAISMYWSKVTPYTIAQIPHFSLDGLTLEQELKYFEFLIKTAANVFDEVVDLPLEQPALAEQVLERRKALVKPVKPSKQPRTTPDSNN